MSTILDHLVDSLRRAANYNPDVQAAPACILWTDADRMWEVIIPALQEHMPELFVLGEYDPAVRRGPAIWLRCVLARTLENVMYPEDATPVLYLPGVSRQDLRAVDSCPDHLKPLAELQYRGVIWSQSNGKDWTILAYLHSAQGGLALDIAQDRETLSAMLITLPNIMDTDPASLRGRRLDRSDFYGLINNDPTGELLKWLNDPEGYRAEKSETHWRAFAELCDYQFKFNPATDGPISAAQNLAERVGTWQAIWDRFCEAAKRYAGIKTQIERASPPSNKLDWREPSHDEYDSWPQWTAFHEAELRTQLGLLLDKPAVTVQAAVIDLERLHGRRREAIWATLGHAPLAHVLEHVAILAKTVSETPLNGGTLDDLVARYQTSGWLADDAVMRCMDAAAAVDQSDRKLVTSLVRSLYVSWAEEAARYLQQLVLDVGYPAPNYSTDLADGTCIVFIDALRFDVAQRLSDYLKQARLDVQQRVTWAALPSVTATGKPAVSPVSKLISGAETNVDFLPNVTETSKPANHHNLHKLLEQNGWQLPKYPDDLGSGSGRAWVEIGVLDKAGHDGVLSSTLASHVKDIGEYLVRVTKAWKRIEIVTDHGWLYTPGGLEKTSLPTAVSENQWGRCAAIKPGAGYTGDWFPWHWNPNQHFVLAPGISCFKSNMIYAHGGLSMQECLTVSLVLGDSSTVRDHGQIVFVDVEWSGLRCKVRSNTYSPELTIDIRLAPSDPSTSVVFKVKPLPQNCLVSLAVEDEELEGQPVYIVAITSAGEVVAQKLSSIGGQSNA
ncbi:MAG: BREX-1 system phosphatase PglZ type B [Chloroflexi bacterium]|nr:BREX-1 system phosphatase PglZ type B [Chloroflexota bacterium]